MRFTGWLLLLAMRCSIYSTEEWNHPGGLDDGATDGLREGRSKARGRTKGGSYGSYKAGQSCEPQRRYMAISGAAAAAVVTRLRREQWNNAHNDVRIEWCIFYI